MSCSKTLDIEDMGEQKQDYDLIVVGSGPGGQKAAIQGAKLGKKVAVIDFNPMMGGVCLHDGTIPSKSFREAILYLSGYRERSHYGKAYRVKERVTMEDLNGRLQRIVRDLEQTSRSQLSRNGITVIEGTGSLLDKNTVLIRSAGREEKVSADYIVLATGTRPRRLPSFEFDDEVILDSDGILHMDSLPKSLCVVGGGVIGSEYGSMFAVLGVKVTIVEARERILGFVDQELIDELVHQMRKQKTMVITGDKVVRCRRSPDGRAVTYLESGKRIVTDRLLVSAGRVPNVEKLNLEAVGIDVDERNLIKVNEFYQTSCSNVYAVGDVIGMPALASTSLEQGRRAACHAFGLRERELEGVFPFGIFTVPEIGMIGKTERELSELRVPYEIGIARFSEVEKGKIVGDTNGVLKILFHRGTLQVLGVHIIGNNSTELIHIGQMVMNFQGTIADLAQNVFNYPSLSQAYKTAALDGLNKVIATDSIPDEVPSDEYDLQFN